MVCRFDDLCCKEIINVKTGAKLGFPDDIEFETHTAKIITLVVYGRSKLFGLLGREEDIIIPWDDIEVIGDDTILVCTEFPHHPKRKGRFFDAFLK